jgi:hypothetical protein
MATFKAIGINSLFLNETENGLYTQLQWRQNAASAGLKYIDFPSSDITADAADPNLQAFVLPLYPDRNGLALSAWQNVYTAIKAVTTKPILGMFGGANVTNNRDANPPYNGSVQAPFLPYADWVGQDWEPINSDPTRYTTSIISDAIRLLGTWSNGKPQMAMIETVYGNFNDNGRAPTTDEMKTEVRNAMANSSCLGWIFDTRVAARNAIAFSFDGTTTAMKTAMTQIISEFTPVNVPRAAKYVLYDDNTWGNA